VSALDDAIAELARFNDDPEAGGITREVYTPTYARGLEEVVRAEMEAAGLLGSSLGPLVVAGISDALAPRFAQESLRYAFSFTVLAPLAAAVLLEMARRRARSAAAMIRPSAPQPSRGLS
jgi:hypothetical protein